MEELKQSYENRIERIKHEVETTVGNTMAEADRVVASVKSLYENQVHQITANVPTKLLKCSIITFWKAVKIKQANHKQHVIKASVVRIQDYQAFSPLVPTLYSLRFQDGGLKKTMESASAAFGQQKNKQTNKNACTAGYVEYNFAVRFWANWRNEFSIVVHAWEQTKSWIDIIHRAERCWKKMLK